MPTLYQELSLAAQTAYAEVLDQHERWNWMPSPD